MSAADIFDDNRYSHDPRAQFLNWALMYNGAWDYPANARGYTPDPARPAVIQGLCYLRAQRNDGFVLLPCSKSCYNAGNRPFSFENTNGFLITIHMDSSLPVPTSSGGM